MLEVVGVQGVVHLGQIQSGLRAAIRIVQGSHIKIHMNCEVPVQVRQAVRFSRIPTIYFFRFGFQSIRLEFV